MPDGDKAPTSRRQIIVTTSIALTGAVALFLLWYLLLRVPFSPAFTNINSNDALTITQELDRLKTPYELADDGATIMVPKNKVDEVRVNILGSDLPLKGAVGFELFNKTDMGLTEFAQKINYQRALQGELARTIMALDQIETARVHLSLPEDGVFEQDRRPAKASITIATKAGGEIDAAVVRGIQQLAAGAVPDLLVANVAILDARGQLLSAATQDVAPLVSTPEQERQLAYEQSLASKIEAAIRKEGVAIPLKVKVTALRSFNDQPQNNSAPVMDSQIDEGDPKNRSYALNVQLQIASMPGQSMQDTLLAAARDAITYNQSLGDVVALQINPMVGSLAAPPVTRVERRAPVEKAISAPALSSIPFWPICGILAMIGLIIIALRWRINTTAPLTDGEKQAFADRLKILLEDQKNDRQPA
jgi:flagellar M-ring protein FliF